MKPEVFEEVLPSRESGRIDGYCQIPGWTGRSPVISLNLNLGQWTVGSSMALPSNIDQAQAILEVYNLVMERLKVYQD